MVKLDKILESMDSFVINSDVALLESEGLDALTIAQTKKSIHESFRFIKSELIQGGVLEETQMLLSNAWTQAILEDVYAPFAPEDQMGFGEEAAIGSGLVASGAAGMRYIPGAAKAYDHYRQQDQSVADSLRAAGANARTAVMGDVNAVRNAAGQAAADGKQAIQNGALKADIIARNTANQVVDGVKDTAQHAKFGYKMGAASENLAKNIMAGDNTAAKVGTQLGRVVRKVKGFTGK